MRCKLIIELLFLITLRNSVKSQSIVETIFLTFYGRFFMKKLSVLFLSFLFIFTSCETLDNLGDSISNLFSGDKETEKTEEPGTKITTPKTKRETVDTSIWALAVLDTARDADYMDDIEKDVILEMNMARTNPAKYAELYIQPRTKKFNGKIYSGNLQTNEGVAVVNECIKFMQTQKPLSVLNPSKGLTQAAKDHANTQSLTDKTGHTGTDGSDPFKRMKKYGSYKTAGENISYGSKTAREIVVTLLIDDGVKSRGHRKNIMSKDFDVAGVGFANKHKLYGCECVLDYAGQYVEK